MEEGKIIELLREVKNKALAFYSDFHVGAVLVTDRNELITGFNIESSSYGLTMCAERVALFKALSEGKNSFKAIYIMSDGEDPCPPCGACRQLLIDYAPDIMVKMISENGRSVELSLKDLLPHAFRDKNLSL